MWLYLAALVVLYHLVHWYWERQVVSHLQDKSAIFFWKAKYVFITGCDSGFGNLLARQLDMWGLRVLAVCLMEKGAEQLRKQTSERLETVILDVTQTESIAAATDCVKEHVGNKGLEGLVNNAGIFCPVLFSDSRRQNFVNILKVNLIGLTEVTLSMLPLVRRARGRIVNVSRALGRVASFAGPYSCSKYGVEAFSDVLRQLLASTSQIASLPTGGLQPGFSSHIRVPAVGRGRLPRRSLHVLAALVGLYHLVCWYQERQVVSYLQDKYVFIMGCDLGFRNLLARLLDTRGLRVLATCLMEKGAEQLRKQTSERLETVILDVTITKNIATAAQWVKERGGQSMATGACPLGRLL
ncbi:LOW QUALITY PROTEIN: 17-beta-hydroxysteroid dehydrogenase type 6-like [Erethizon dorsatum]